MDEHGADGKPTTIPQNENPMPNIELPRTDDPLEFLIAAMNNPLVDVRTRMRAAMTAAQYTGKKTRELGKKELAAEAAGEAARTGRFAPSAPPRLHLVKAA